MIGFASGLQNSRVFSGTKFGEIVIEFNIQKTTKNVLARSEKVTKGNSVKQIFPLKTLCPRNIAKFRVMDA